MSAFLVVVSGCPKAPSLPTGIPERMVCLSCAGADIFLALGEEKRLVAVEEDCPLPGLEDVQKIRNEDHPGKLAAFNVETVLALHPDVVIAQPDLKQALTGRGLRVIWTVDHYTYENLPDLVRKGGVMDTMIDVAGGVNIAHEIERHWANMTPEAIFAADPDVIIMGPWAGSVEDVYARPGWDEIKAVRNKRVYKLEPPNRNVAQATPRCVVGCEKFLLPWLHPELFPERKER